MLAPRHFLRPLVLASFISLALGASGCSQEDGDSCQVTRDCADGLICVVSMGSVRGTCRSPADVMDAATCDPENNPDQCVPINDASLGDASLDAGGDANVDAGGDASLDAGDASDPDGSNADDDAGG